MSSTSVPEQGSIESVLRSTLILLFEESVEIRSTLVPQLLASLGGTEKFSLTSTSQVYDIVDESIRLIHGWSPDLQARFIAGHPRIGETRNLSALSSREQAGGTTTAAGGAAAPPTPPEVLQRLQHLNACYERVYPGLRYITFVNGRSRAVIAEEMEDKLGVVHSLLPDQPPLESLVPVQVGGPTWLAELHRAVEDIGHIAKSRLEKVDQEGLLHFAK